MASTTDTRQEQLSDVGSQDDEEKDVVQEDGRRV